MTDLHWPSLLMGVLLAYGGPVLAAGLGLALRPGPQRFRTVDQVLVEQFLKDDLNHPWRGE